MMKKNVTLMLISLLAMMFSLTGCGASTSEVNALRQEIASLEEQVDMLEEKQELYDNMLVELQANVADTSKEAAVENAETTSEEDETKPENIETSKPETAELEMAEKEAGDGDFQNLMAYIEEQIESNDFDCWMEVAECEYVTSEQLVAIAQNCAKIEIYNGYYYQAENGQKKLVDAILANSALTDEVLRQLLKSEYVSIWLKVAASEKCSSITLFEIAKKCTEMESYNGYHYQAENGQNKLADVILENSALTDDVLRKLLDSKYPSIWFKALASDKCSEETLILAAKMCVNIKTYNGYNSMAEGGQLAMAEIILENPALTENVLKEFVNSEYASVVSLGHQTIETIETAANSD